MGRAGHARPRRAADRPTDDKGEPLPFAVPCDKCGNHLDTDQLEAKLTEVINAVSVRYANQDLRCVKCKKVARSLLRTHCPCSGVYQTDIDTDKLNDYFRIVRDVAGHFAMGGVEEIMDAFIPVDKCIPIK